MSLTAPAYRTVSNVAQPVLARALPNISLALSLHVTQGLFETRQDEYNIQKADKMIQESKTKQDKALDILVHELLKTKVE